MSEIAVEDHFTLCGSWDVFLVRNSIGWCLIEGLELSPRQALELLARDGWRDRAIDFETKDKKIKIGWFSHEEDAKAAFEAKREGKDP